MDIFASYANLWKILRLRNIQIFALFSLTVRFGTGAIDGMSRLKLVEKGIPRETLAFYSIPLIPLKLALPIILSKWTVGSSPMRVFITAVPFSLLFGVIWPMVIIATSYIKTSEDSEEQYPFWFYAVLFCLIALELLPNYARFVTAMGFAAQVADPSIGGTYMTLLNTLGNIGAMWPSTVALALVDYVGIKIPCDRNFQKDSAEIIFKIPEQNNNFSNVANYSIIENDEILPCYDWNIDGFYVESVVFVAIGFIWLFWGRPVILRLQKRDKETWKVVF
jgi:PAT family acetyl-CoA transporter-like MFS transporter 1